MLKNIEFSVPVDFIKIQHLSYFDSFTNVLVKHILTHNNFKLPNKIKHLTYDRCVGTLPIPENLISLHWLTKQKINMDDIPNSLQILEIKNQEAHAKIIIRNLKNVRHLIVAGNNKVDFHDYYPASVQQLSWNCDRNPDLNNNWNLKHLSISDCCDRTIQHIPFSVETLEINDVKNFRLRYDQGLVEKIKKLIFNSDRIKFLSEDNSWIYENDRNYENNYVPQLPKNCSIKELVFGKNFTRSVTYIIPSSVTKCTFYGGYKGTLPPTVREVIILPQ
jgi:hypothetical protein